MRQVTGRSSKNSTIKASIRLASGGRFFSASMVENVAEEGDIVVTIDTPRATLVTAQILSELSAETILAINGQNLLSSEVAVVSDAIDNKLAVIALDKKAHDLLVEKFSERLHFTSPLLSTTHSDKNAFIIETADSSTYYLRLYNNGLQLAEALDLASEDELLYYVANILDIAATDIPIYINSEEKKVIRLLKKYYKVICE